MAVRAGKPRDLREAGDRGRRRSAAGRQSPSALGASTVAWASVQSPEGRGTVAAVDIVFGGEEGSVTLEVTPDGRVERLALQVGPLAGQIATVIGLDLPRMRDDLAAALSSRTLTGGTSMESVEHD